MILTYPIPGPEERHVRYLRENGLALYAETLAEVPRLATRLLSSAGELSEIRRRSREWSRPDASHAVAQVAVALLREGDIHRPAGDTSAAVGGVGLSHVRGRMEPGSVIR